MKSYNVCLKDTAKTFTKRLFYSLFDCEQEEVHSNSLYLFSRLQHVRSMPIAISVTSPSSLRDLDGNPNLIDSQLGQGGDNLVDHLAGTSFVRPNDHGQP